MRYRTRTNGVSERLDEEPLGSGFFSCFVPAQRLRLTRYVRRVRELCQNVSSHTLCRSRFSLTVCFCSHTIFTCRRLFVQIRSLQQVHSSRRSWSVPPFRLSRLVPAWRAYRVRSCDSQLTIPPSRCKFVFSFSVCGACKTGTLHPLFTVRAKRSSASSKVITAVTANGRMAATSPRGASFISIFFAVVWAAVCLYRPHADSPRMAVPVGTGVRMPGSFGFDDDDDAELDELVLSVRKLGIRGKE